MAAMANPIQQGLKQEVDSRLVGSRLAAMANPIQQGLKHSLSVSDQPAATGRNG